MSIVIARSARLYRLAQKLAVAPPGFSGVQLIPAPIYGQRIVLDSVHVQADGTCAVEFLMGPNSPWQNSDSSQNPTVGNAVAGFQLPVGGGQISYQHIELDALQGLYWSFIYPWFLSPQFLSAILTTTVYLTVVWHKEDA